MVVTGRVRVRPGEGAGHRPDLILGQGELVGELALLTGRTRTADVVAEEDCDLMVISRAAFQRALRDRPEAATGILQVVAERLADAMTVP